VPRSVAIGYTDGTRMPVVLKEALIDPETDLAGIQRDFGVHISSVARVLAKMECHPVFTEGASGTTLNLLFRTSEDFLFDSYGSRSGTSPDLSGLKLIHCEGSRIVRESVAEALKNHGLDVLEASSLQEALEVMQSHGSQLLLLDSSLIPEPVEESLEEFLTDHPSLVMILTRTAASVQIPIPARYSENVRLLEKPYSMDQLLNIFETMTETGGQEGAR